jgi:hypothetical protein
MEDAKCCVANLVKEMEDVVTLALGSRPRQGLTKVWAKSEPESHIFMLLGVQESVRE